MHAAIFATLKRSLKQRGLTYAALAVRMELSEATIKRIFAEENCKLDRMAAICAAAEIDFASVVNAASRPPPAPGQLSIETEAALARDMSLAMVLFFLTEGFSAKAICETARITEASCFLYLRDLERLGLVRIGHGMEVALLTPAPLQYRRDGPMAPIIRQVNQKFVGHVLRTLEDGSLFESLSRRMRPETYAMLRRETEELARRARDLAHHDQMTTPAAELIGCKWTAMIAEDPFRQIFTVAPHPRAPREVARKPQNA
ncbi:MAG: helix-turn-helix transcriptional regulator [Albidovulum sp.]